MLAIVEGSDGVRWSAKPARTIAKAIEQNRKIMDASRWWVVYSIAGANARTYDKSRCRVVLRSSPTARAWFEF
jgi:hypothetical protein